MADRTPASPGRSFFQIIHRMSPIRGLKKPRTVQPKEPVSDCSCHAFHRMVMPSARPLCNGPTGSCVMSFHEGGEQVQAGSSPNTI